MKYFFRIIRVPLGIIVLLMERLTRPKSPNHTPEHQAKLDAATAEMKLYQFKACPFCAKTRKGIHGLGLKIEQRDAKRNQKWRQELIEEGGKLKAPCLRVTKEDGKIEWIYESDAILDYLGSRFAA